MPQESGLFNAANHYDFGFGVKTFNELECVMRKGPSEWNRKRDSIPQFYTPFFARDLVERMQPANVRA
jgi:hypothetical protein